MKQNLECKCPGTSDLRGNHEFCDCNGSQYWRVFTVMARNTGECSRFASIFFCHPAWHDQADAGSGHVPRVRALAPKLVPTQAHTHTHKIHTHTHTHTHTLLLAVLQDCHGCGGSCRDLFLRVGRHPRLVGHSQSHGLLVRNILQVCCCMQTGIARVAARVAKTAATNCFQPVPGRRTVNSSLLVDRWSVRVSGDTMCVSSTCAALLTLFFVVIGLAFILVGLVWILRTAPLFAGRLRPFSCVRGDVSVCLYMIQYRPQHFRNHQWSNS